MSEHSEELTVVAEVIGETVGGRTDYIMKIGNQEIEVSRQLFEDEFSYDEHNCVIPPYPFDPLLYFLENNTWHSRCCRLKAACTVGLGYTFVTKLPTAEADEQEIQDLFDFFENCNPNHTFTEILSNMELDYEAIGNGYLEIIRNLSGEIVKIFHIPAQTMRVKKDRSGFVQLRDNRYVFFKNFGDETVYDRTGKKEDKNNPIPFLERASEIIHFSQYSPRSTYYGIPEWLPSMSAMLGSEKAEDFNIQFFENNAVPQFAIIIRKAKLGSDVKSVIANYFKKEIKGKNHKTLVLEVPGEGELEMKELAGDIKDASFRLYRLDNRDEIIAAHGVPPRMVGVIATGSLGGKNDSDGQKEVFLTQIIGPRQTSLNNKFNKILIGNGMGAKIYKFLLEKLNPSDDEKDSLIYERYVKLGIYSINQVRDKIRESRLDSSEFPGADEHFIYTTSGPILVSKLKEYMDVALLPSEPQMPKPPGLGITGIKQSNVKRTGEPADVKKALDEFLEIHKQLIDELAKLKGGEPIATDVSD